MTVLLAIDPARSTGWAILVDKKVVDCGVHTCEPYSSQVYDHQVHKPNQVIFEHPQIYRPGESKGNPNDLAGLIFQIGRFWQYYVMTYNATCRVIYPNEWKGQLSKDVCAARVWGMLIEPEQLVVSRAGRGLSKKPLSDMMDAVGIGLYGVGRSLRF